MNPFARVTLPASVVRTTSTEPAVPAGVVIVTEVVVFAVMVAAFPPKVTPVVLMRFVPEITVDVEPAVTPETTEREVIVGCGQLDILVTIEGGVAKLANE